jgi:hypothetical protein
VLLPSLLLLVPLLVPLLIPLLFVPLAAAALSPVVTCRKAPAAKCG